MKKTLLFVALSLTIFTASAKIYSIATILSGANEVPANASTATGTVIGTYDDVSLLLNLTITFNGLTTNANSGHVHKAVVGVNGPVIIPFINVPTTTSGTFNYSGTLTAPQAADLLAGLYYVNIHNTAFPGGEIRGQLAATALQVFNINNILDFNAIGGYSYTEGTFPDGIIASPYLRSGPLPQNDFTFEAMGVQLYGFQDKLTTFNGGQSITFTFKGNNVRKMRSLVRSEDINGVVQAGNVTVTATTNLGNTANIIANSTSQFAGFRVMNENEYITQVVFSGPSDGQFTTIDDIMFGDDQAQNVALNFDGVNDYVSIPSAVGNFETNQDFTVTTWVKIPSANQSNTLNPDNDILEKWSFVGGYPFVIRYNNHTASVGDRFKINVGRWDGTNNPNMSSTVTLNDDKWHHIAFVKSGPNLKLYIDGLENNITTDNTTGNTTNTSPLFVGSRGNNTNYFKGEIDEIRIWNIAKTDAQIANERFCKTPSPTNLVAFYNFNNGVPNGNNTLNTQVPDAIGTNNGSLINFTKTGDASNFVTGQVKYVNGNNLVGLFYGSSWADGFPKIQDALNANTCNDLFEVYVAANTSPYKPSNTGDINVSFNIPTGMRIYGGFTGTEKSINQRNMALIQSTNQTTLSGDLGGNDILSDFSQNRTDNSKTVIKIDSKSNVIIDGFNIRGGFGGSLIIGNGGNGGGIFADNSSNCIINNVRFFDNIADGGGAVYAGKVTNLKITNCSFLGNSSNDGGNAIYVVAFQNVNASMVLNNCIISGNIGNGAIRTISNSLNGQVVLNHSYTNCTFANNNRAFNNSQTNGSGQNNFSLKNSIIYGNSNDNISDGTINQSITNSLIQGETSTANGNLVGTTNPNFVLLPTPTGTPSLAGDYRLKDSSPCINTGTDVGGSPLDLDRNPRPKGGKTDMGAYESNVNMNEIISIATGNWETPTTWNLARVPLATDKVIMNGHTVTVTTPNAKAKNIEQKPSSDLKFNAGGSMQLNQ